MYIPLAAATLADGDYSAKRKPTDAQIIERAYGGTTPIRIPSAKHCAMLWAHPEFEPLAEKECEFNAEMEPQTPGLLGYLRGVPAYFAPVKK
jgi:hypothetical protein